jgi:energy-coupling factor transporter ATP-binding protein EcfA2
VIISGGTGSGKTTLLNCLTNYIEHDERIITCEDAAELQLQQPHVVRLETRPPNIEGEGQVTMRELVRNCLRMRPERIIVGEVRGPEAFDLLQAMNTGHDGSMGTLHANNPREALSRCESMITMGGFSLPSRTIREMICASVDIIVQANGWKADSAVELVTLEMDPFGRGSSGPGSKVESERWPDAKAQGTATHSRHPDDAKPIAPGCLQTTGSWDRVVHAACLPGSPEPAVPLFGVNALASQPCRRGRDYGSSRFNSSFPALRRSPGRPGVGNVFEDSQHNRQNPKSRAYLRNRYH